MSKNFPEADWKAFRRNRDRMLETLFERINDESAKILDSPDPTPEQIYRNLFDHVKTSDRVVADCFDNWKRSNFALFASHLLSEGLIPDSLWEHLSEETRKRLKTLTEIRDM